MKTLAGRYAVRLAEVNGGTETAWLKGWDSDGVNESIWLSAGSTDDTKVTQLVDEEFPPAGEQLSRQRECPQLPR